jgi:thiol-disulfide isomerase/thioredoxin
MMKKLWTTMLIALACASLSRAQESPAPAPAAPAQAPATPRAWFENFSYRVEVDGALSPQARLFITQGRPSLLLVAPELKRPAVIQINGHEVFQAEAASVADGPIPTQVALADSEIRGPADPYTRDGDAVIFFRDGHRIRVSPRPPLIGPATTEDVLNQLPAYRKGMGEYTPSGSDIFYLKGYKYDVKVDVFFGSWCPHCRVMVPMLLKSIAEAANPKIQLSFHGVPPPPFGSYAPARENKIDGVPTFIVYADGKEIGRFSAIAGDSRVEHELVKILYAYEQSKG